MWHDILTKFHEDWFRRSSNIKVQPQKFERMEGIYEVRHLDGLRRNDKSIKF
jgi:hypothetical protein